MPPERTTSGWTTSTPAAEHEVARLAAAVRTISPAASRRSVRARRGLRSPRRRPCRQRLLEPVHAEPLQLGRELRAPSPRPSAASRSPGIRQPWFASTISSRSDPTASRTASTTARSRRQSLVVEAELHRPDAARRAARRSAARAPPARRARRSTRRRAVVSSGRRGAARAACRARGRRGPRRRPRAIQFRAAVEVDRLDRSRATTSVANGSRPTSKRSRSVAIGQVVAARVALHARRRSATTTTRRVLVRARHGIPGGAERRVERIAVPPRLDRRDPHSARRRRTGSAASRGARRARAAAAGSRPSTHTPSAFRIAARLASRTAVSSSAAGSIQTATRTTRSPLASISPSATASSTPWPMPSWAAPHVIVWCRSVERGRLVHHQRRRPHRLVLRRRRPDADEHRRVPGRGVREHRSRPRRRSGFRGARVRR